MLEKVLRGSKRSDVYSCNSRAGDRQHQHMFPVGARCVGASTHCVFQPPNHLRPRPLLDLGVDLHTSSVYSRLMPWRHSRTSHEVADVPISISTVCVYLLHPPGTDPIQLPSNQLISGSEKFKTCITSYQNSFFCQCACVYNIIYHVKN